MTAGRRCPRRGGRPASAAIARGSKQSCVVMYAANGALSRSAPRAAVVRDVGVAVAGSTGSRSSARRGPASAIARRSDSPSRKSPGSVGVAADDERVIEPASAEPRQQRRRGARGRGPSAPRGAGTASKPAACELGSPGPRWPRSPCPATPSPRRVAPGGSGRDLVADALERACSSNVGSRARARAPPAPGRPSPRRVAAPPRHQTSESGKAALRCVDVLEQRLVDAGVDRRRLVLGEHPLPDRVRALRASRGEPSSSHCSKLLLSAVSER